MKMKGARLVKHLRIRGPNQLVLHCHLVCSRLASRLYQEEERLASCLYREERYQCPQLRGFLKRLTVNIGILAAQRVVLDSRNSAVLQKRHRSETMSPKVTAVQASEVELSQRRSR